MNQLLFVCFALFLLVPQPGASSSGGLEGYTAYIRGLCVGLGLDCDLSTLTSCWDQTSGAMYLAPFSKICLAVANAPPKDAYSAIQKVLSWGNEEDLTPMLDALTCEQKLR